MQLTRTALAAAFVAIVSPAQAQVGEIDTTHSFFYEAATRTHMLVYSPSADVQVSPASWLDLRGGWEADVVSGASVKTKAGAAYGAAHSPDVVTTASVHDLRNLGRAELIMKGDTTALTAGYAYGTEHDYQSHSVHVSARTDSFQRNTQFELSYSRNFDSICDRTQSASANGATRWVALESSSQCFTSAPGRTTHAIAIDTYEATWTQSLTPVIATQLTYSAQLIDGFQSDPYRSVILGEGVVAQEHEPNTRAREALTLRAAWYLRALRGAVRVALRGYHDTWAIDSGSAEIEAEKSVGEALRLLVRGRYYRQSGALFWSDDYTSGSPPLGPKGQYWTGDRKLSPMSNWLAGIRAVWTFPRSNSRLVGVIEGLKLSASANVAGYAYDEYTLAGLPISNALSCLGTLSVSATF